MPNESTAAGASRCLQCGAPPNPGAVHCWLCGAGVSLPGPPAHAASQPVAVESLGGFSLASLMMFVTLFAVVLGLSTIAPGIGIPLGIVLLIVWLRTTAVVKYRRAHGRAVTREEKLHLFLASFGVGVALLAVICVAGCAALVAACFACVGTWSALGADSGSGIAVAWIVFTLVIAAIAIPVLWKTGKFVARRWRQDIGGD